MADDIVTRLKRELEEIRRSGYGHDWPLSQAIAVIETQQAEIERLRTAGDALAKSLAEFNDPQDGMRLLAWQEVRRG